LRAGGSGIPAFFTPTGANTVIEYGTLVTRYNPDGTVAKLCPKREVREFNGRKYLMEEAIKGDFALIKGYQADEYGNIVFRKTARNFNPECARAANICIAEVEEIVPAGTLPPDLIHLPHCYVDRVVKTKVHRSRDEYKKIESHLKIPAASGNRDMDKRSRIAKRIVQEIQEGMYVNLGIGIPTLCANFIDPNSKVFLESENGVLGIGPHPCDAEMDPDLVNAGK
jgi:3-oxoacid CoA-transferase